MAQEKIKCAIIGSGNIGTDLMMKLLRSDKLEPTVMIGIDPESKGLAKAKELGLITVDNGIDGFIEEHVDKADIVYEATSAKAHAANAPILKKLGKKAIDLTPAAVGPFVVPSVSLDQNIQELDNVNMVTCGGQATIPIVRAISDVVNVKYAEIVASISSRSAGPGTRQNIDEFTETTANALKDVGGVDEAKAIIILNPAEPPVLMRNTIYAEIANYSEDKDEAILESVDNMMKTVQSYVKGYRYKQDPIIKDGVVTVAVEVEGNGDFLPKYAGNLDIITSAAVKTGEVMAESLVAKGVSQ